MTINLRFLPPIPEGMRVFEADLEVAGVQHRMGYCLAFARRTGHGLEFEREPGNRHDPNAIKVLGISKGWFLWAKCLLGYVPRETAARIAEAGNWDVIVPRLKNVWAGGYFKDVVHIRFDILNHRAGFSCTIT